MPPCAKPISAKKKAPAMTEAPLLEVADIETSYGLSRVLFGISLAVGSGEMVSLMGRNGMGKTTTVRSIMGLTRPAAGSIRFAGAELRELPPYRIAKLGLGLVPEGRQVFPNLTTRENLACHRRQPQRRRGSVDDSRRSTICFHALPCAPAAWRTCSPAASSRCWRSGAR